MICPECKKERLQLAPFYKGGKATTMCTVCALKEKNEYHGLPEGTRFGGAIANQMYEDEIAFEKKGKK